MNLFNYIQKNKRVVVFIAFLLVSSLSSFGQTVNKRLYLSDPAQALDRIDPVATSDLTTSQTATLYKNAATLVTSGTVSTANGGTASSISTSYTVATGTNRLLVVGIGSVPVSPVTSVTFNGVALTKLSQIANATTSKAEIWYLIAPPQVTANVVVNWTGTVEASVGIANFVNVDQINPFGTVATSTQNVTSPFNYTVASNIGDIIFDVVAKNGNSPAVTTGQTLIFGSGTNSVKVASSYKTATAGTTAMSWTSSGSSAAWSGIGVAVKGFSNDDAIFTQTPNFCSNFIVKSGSTITVRAFASVVTGSITSPAPVTARLSYNGILFFNSNSATWNSTNNTFTWTGTVPSDVTIPSGQAVTLAIESDLTSATFKIDYDSNTKPSYVELPTSTYINVSNIAVYNAPYPGGSIVTSGSANQTYYVRTTVTDPFGSSDITGESVAITGPSSYSNSGSATVVNTATCSKIYEYSWTTPSPSGSYSITATANEGTEGITHAANTTFSILAPGLSVSKVLTTPASGPYQINNNLVYTITVTNTGTINYTSVPLSDTFNPSCLQFVSATVTPTSTTSGQLNWTNLGALAVGNSHTIQVTMKVLANCDPASNTATVSGAIDALSNVSGTFSSTVNTNIDVPPVANNDTYSCVSGSTALNVLANDTDGDNHENTFTVSIVSAPAASIATLSINPDKTIQFVPGPSIVENSTITFIYRVCDVTNLCNQATVTLFYSSVNNPPVVLNQNLNLSPDLPHIISVLSGATDADGTINISSLTISQPPTNGVAYVNSNGTVTYVPNPGFEGSDVFKYKVYDTGCPGAPTFSEGTITINVFSAFYACVSSVSTVTVPFNPEADNYIWTLPSGATILSGNNTNSIQVNWSGVPAGEHQVCAQTSNECGLSATECVTIILGQISLSATPTNVGCFGTSTGAIDLTVSGGFAPYTYSWSNGAQVQDPNNLSAGSYTVTVTDYKGCTATLTQVITAPASAISATAVITDQNLNTSTFGAIDLTVTGGTSGYTYAWSGPSGFTASTQDITGLVGGTYTVIITDANGCKITKYYTVNSIGAPLSIAAIIPTNVNCFNGTDGSVNLEIIGGTAPFTYSWTGPSSFTANTQDISNLPIGTYNVTVTDATLAYVTSSVQVTGPVSALVATLVPTNPSCSGIKNGAIDLQVSGGTAPYSYTWSNGASIEDLSNLQAGTYTIVIRDTNGCTLNRNVTLTAPAPLAINSVIVDNKCGTSNSGSINVTVSGGTAPYSFSWTGSNAYTASTEDLTSLPSGIYSLIVTDASGCQIGTTLVVDTVCIGVSKIIEGTPINNGNGTYTLQYVIKVQNYGTTDLQDVQITENLNSTFSGATQYSVASIFSSTLPVNTSFNGNSNQNLLQSGFTLFQNQYGLILLTVTVTPGSNLGAYNNNVTATGNNGSGVNVSDISTNNSNPDPDNDGPGNDSTATPVTFTENPLIGVAKALTSGPINNGNGTYDISFTILVSNLGDVPLTNVQVTDNLTTAFAGSTVQVLGLTSTTLSVNSSYNGTSNINLLSSGNNLAINSNGTIVLNVRVTPNASGTFENTAVASGTSPSGNTVSDNSQNGNNPDSDNDGIATDNNDPTPITFPENPSIGIAKAVTSGPTNNGDGSYTLTYTIKVKNTGDVQLNNVQVTDNLASTFSGATFSVTSLTSAGLSVNTSYNGSSNINLLTGSNTLAIGSEQTIVLTVTVTPATNLGSFNNTAIGNAQSTSGTSVSDNSTNGNDVDPENNGPTDNSDVTPVSFTENPSIGVAKEVTSTVNNGNGTHTVVYSIKVENTGDVRLNNVNITENLSTVFSGATAFSVTGLTSSTLTVNPSFNGTSNTLLLATGNSLFVNQSGTITLTLLVTPGTNLGTYNNSVVATGTSPGGSSVTDNSNNGNDVDPNNDGDPTNDTSVTPLLFTESPSLGIAKAMTGFVDNGNGSYNVTYQITVSNTGDVQLHNLTLDDNLGDTFANATSFNFVSLTSANFSVNTSYNGTTNTALLNGSDSLNVGQTGTLTLVVNVTPSDYNSPYENSVFGTAVSPTGNLIFDVSQDGLDVDPDNDGPEDNNVPTPLILPRLVIASTKQVTSCILPMGDGTYTVNYSTVVSNIGEVNLVDVQLEDNLTIAFGTYTNGTPTAAGQYTISTPPQIVSIGAGSILHTNSSYSGSGGQIGLLNLTSGDHIAPGQSATVTFTVQFIPAVGVTTFANQITAKGDKYENGVANGMSVDLSNNGTIADPDNDGIANQSLDPDNNIFIENNAVTTFEVLPCDTNTDPACKPQTPGPITASSNNTCNVTQITYSIAPVLGATSYQWTIPAGGTITSGQGTTSITVDLASTYFNGNVCVEGVNNTCVSPAPSCLTANIFACIVAVDDTYGPFNGYTGGTTASVLVNDTINGVVVNPSDVTVSGVTIPSGFTLNSDGTITIASGTTSGTYTLSYQICEVVNPTNCDTADVTITIANVIDAVDDAYGSINGYTGATTASVLTNDTLNGVQVNPSEITLTPNTVPTGLTLNANGTITIAPGTPAGTYTVTYTICEVLNPSNCDTAD
ncbi:beta strand repeat-containing protein, partial [Flavobacterium sp.]|uniref:beta strand repeat-containing protein n=1 Tax=Flavobacterium sp. TaxID=239 RepID=UPI002FDDB4DA